MKFVNLITATDGKHKYTVTLKDSKDKLYRVHFGAKGYQDFTLTNNEDHKKSYIARHSVTENWTASGILTAGFWSRWLLWNKKTIKTSLQDIKKRFNI